MTNLASVVFLIFPIFVSFSAHAESLIINGCDVFKLAEERLSQGGKNYAEEFLGRKFTLTNNSIGFIREVVYTPTDGKQGIAFGAAINVKTCVVVDTYAYQ